MRTETDDEVSTQDEDDDYEEIEEFESQLSFSSSTHEDLKPVNIENGSSDQFGTVRTINTAANRIHHSDDFMTAVNSNTQQEATRVTKSRPTLSGLEAKHEGPLRQRGAA